MFFPIVLFTYADTANSVARISHREITGGLRNLDEPTAGLGADPFEMTNFTTESTTAVDSLARGKFA